MSDEKETISTTDCCSINNDAELGICDSLWGVWNLLEHVWFLIRYTSTEGLKGLLYEKETISTSHCPSIHHDAELSICDCD